MDNIFFSTQNYRKIYNIIENNISKSYNINIASTPIYKKKGKFSDSYCAHYGVSPYKVAPIRMGLAYMHRGPPKSRPVVHVVDNRDQIGC